jgi:hypothetical protein
MEFTLSNKKSKANIKLADILKEIDLSELESVATNLGLKSVSFDAVWNNYYGQFNYTLQTMQDAKIDTSTTFLLFQMIDYLRNEIVNVRTATSMMLSEFIQLTSHKNLMNLQKMEDLKIKAKARRLRHKEKKLLSIKEKNND